MKKSRTPQNLATKCRFIIRIGLSGLAIFFGGCPLLEAGPGEVVGERKISATEGEFMGVLAAGDEFGSAAVGIGDLDGDGIEDLAVGALNADDGGDKRGSVWILFLNGDGTVKAEQEISDTEGTFVGSLDDVDRFGSSVAHRSELLSLVVGASGDDDGGSGRGAVWLINITEEGKAFLFAKISDTAGGFTGVLDDGDTFGSSVADIGDLDGNGVADLAVGARGDDDGGDFRGAVWILFMNASGAVIGHQKISDTAGSFTGVLHDGDLLGLSIANLGDLDGDGVGDIAVGTVDDDGGEDRGAVWILFLKTDGAVKSHQKISDTAGTFSGVLKDSDIFGSSITNLGDLNGDGTTDIAVGASGDDDGGASRGAVWILFLRKNGTVKDQQKINGLAGRFEGILPDGSAFGESVASFDDFNGSGVQIMAAGADGDNAVWIFSLQEGPLQPDLRVGSVRNPARHRGDDIRNHTGARQIVRVRSRGGRRVNFYFSAVNDNTYLNDLGAMAPRGRRGIRITYFRLSGFRENVTADLTRGAGETIRDTPPGTPILFRAKVRLPRGRSVRQVVRLTLFALPQTYRKDVGKVRIRP